MAGSEDGRSGQKRQKGKDWLKSPFMKLKNMSTKAGERSLQRHRPNKLSTSKTKSPDGTETPVAQSAISGVAQSASLGFVENASMESALETPAPSGARAAEPSVMETRLGAASTSRPSSAQLDTNSDNLSVLGAVDTTPTASRIASKASRLSLKPIKELWNEAYEELKEKEESIIKDYEAAMSEHGAPKVPVGRKEQMAALVEKKVAEAKKNTWKLRYGDNEVVLKDLAEPIVKLISDAEKFVDGLVSANPYASIAWAGVSLLLPLFLNPSKQAVSLATGLSYIGNLIVRSDMRQTLYGRQYKTDNGSEELHEYRDTLKELYIRILKFEAKCVCYYSKNAAKRLGRDVAKWDMWDSLLQDITDQEGEFMKLYGIKQDLVAQGEYEKLSSRHIESMDILNVISKNIAGFKQAVASVQSEKNRTKLVEWLSTADPSINYNSAREKHEPETGDWLIKDSTDFKSWFNAPNSFLWVNGKAGSGKTILSSSVIKHLKVAYGQDPQVALAYFYFRFDDKETPNTLALMRSLIKQLYCFRPNTPEAVEALHEYRKNGQNPDLDGLRNALTATIRGFSGVYLILDALDEYSLEASGRKRLLDFIRQIQNSGLQNLHILCTSRREVDIEKALKPICSTTITGNIDVNLESHRWTVNRDIGLHIDNTLASETYSEWSEELKKEVRQALVERADGMFQYISCQFDALRDLPGPRAIREALGDLPDGLDATYDRMLQSIKRKYRSRAANVLTWLSFSIRPLFVKELAEIFILDRERKPPFDEADRLNLPESVLNYLPSLIIKVLRGGENDLIEIRLAHFSIKEYLISPRISQGPAKYFFINERDANLHISEDCLAYHLHLSSTVLATEEQFVRFALWNYALRFWVDHLEQVPRPSWTSSATEMALKAFTPGSQSLLNMNRLRDPDKKHKNWDLKFSGLVSPLYYMAASGTTQLAEFLLDKNFEIEERSPGLFCFALQAAAANGNENMVQLLLNRGADANAQGGIFGRALQAAAWSGQNRVIQLLLDGGADINAKTRVLYGNILYTAIARNHIYCAEFLISRGAKIYLPGLELEEEIRRIEVTFWLKDGAGRLRKFQEDPSGYIAAAKAVNVPRRQVTGQSHVGDCGNW